MMPRAAANRQFRDEFSSANADASNIPRATFDRPFRLREDNGGVSCERRELQKSEKRPSTPNLVISTLRVSEAEIPEESQRPFRCISRMISFKPRRSATRMLARCHP